jgi:hypothetical protein
VIPAWLARSQWIVIVAAVGCDPTPPPPLSPTALAVEVRKADPPEGSTDLGRITATDGFGCGALASNGTYEGAVANLRREAAKRGANYAEIVGIVEPHFTGDCDNNIFTIQARLFRVRAAPAAPRPSLTVDTCDPPCSPGYACELGVCTALCNPPCDNGMVCRQDRTCGRPPAAPPPPALTPPVH